ncbi:hypothetical protein PDESU_03348 [Pontiella desulfatans]|uniref:Uncharacterized protein n=1 Tax=Pontiella desulfatans TaxID=2750659 RepID=A0A6C2U4M2_PONDE|nr:hypothetical protein [Pontiella desulfatans]VGO14779.1 hypothetical protein PDESU_03348 [Pontiella desulfatans]
MKTQRFFCKDCNEYRKCEGRTPSHILHLLLSIITGGIWLIVWLILLLKPQAWHCATCGSRRIAKHHELSEAIKNKRQANPVAILIGLLAGIAIGFWLMLSGG